MNTSCPAFCLWFVHGDPGQSGTPARVVRLVGDFCRGERAADDQLRERVGHLAIGISEPLTTVTRSFSWLLTYVEIVVNVSLPSA